MAQKLRDDKIGVLSHSGGIITLSASTSSITWLTIGGQQYKVTSSLNRTIVTDVTLTLQNLYMVYAVRNAGNTELRISTNVNSIGPSGFSSWKLVGAFYTNTSATFNGLVSNKSETASTIVRFITGSGTYITPPQTLELVFLVAGGGGSGSGGGNNDAGSGSGGNPSTINSTLIVGSGGSGGTPLSSGGAGGLFTINSPALDIGSSNGSYGDITSMAIFGSFTNSIYQGGTGGSGFGAGGGGGYTTAGVSALDNTGGGGGGGGLVDSGGGYHAGGSGGGGGGIARAKITSPASSYTYSVAAQQTTVGAAGTSGGIGGQGGSGLIVIEEIKPNLEQLKDL